MSPGRGKLLLSLLPSLASLPFLNSYHCCPACLAHENQRSDDFSRFQPRMFKTLAHLISNREQLIIQDSVSDCSTFLRAIYIPSGCSLDVDGYYIAPGYGTGCDRIRDRWLFSFAFPSVPIKYSRICS
jgi:hypothetical protein